MHWSASQKLCFLLLKQKNQLGVQERNTSMEIQMEVLSTEAHPSSFMDFRWTGLVASQILEELCKLGEQSTYSVCPISPAVLWLQVPRGLHSSPSLGQLSAGMQPRGQGDTGVSRVKQRWSGWYRSVQGDRGAVRVTQERSGWQRSARVTQGRSGWHRGTRVTQERQGDLFWDLSRAQELQTPHTTPLTLLTAAVGLSAACRFEGHCSLRGFATCSQGRMGVLLLPSCCAVSFFIF